MLRTILLIIVVLFPISEIALAVIKRADARAASVRDSGSIVMMRRLGLSIPPVDRGRNIWADGKLTTALADELRRVVALLPGVGPERRGAPDLLVWDETGLSAEACETLSQQLSLPVNENI